MSALLEVRGLDAWYGERQVLRGLDVTVAAGGVTALLGANGAGKTTTLRALSGLVHRRGRVAFDGRPIGRLAPEEIARLGIAHVPEGRGTFAGLTTLENLRLGAMTRARSRAIRADIERCFHHFPVLAERRGQPAGTLSGGEQQMLAIARALMLRPRLMLLDEPSFGLAPMVVRRIFDMLADLNREDGVALLIVEQNAALALDLADRACLIETGVVVLSGAARAIAADDAVRASYLGY